MEFKFCDILDVDYIASLESESMTKPWNIAQIKDFIKNGQFILKLTIDNIIVGYVSYEKVLDEVNICNINVVSKFRKKGYGELILRYLIDILKTSDVDKIFLEVSEHNLIARHLYEKLKFKNISKRKNYYGENDSAIIMQLNLK